MDSLWHIYLAVLGGVAAFIFLIACLATQIAWIDLGNDEEEKPDDGPQDGEVIIGTCRVYH